MNKIKNAWRRAALSLLVAFSASALAAPDEKGDAPDRQSATAVATVQDAGAQNDNTQSIKTQNNKVQDTKWYDGLTISVPLFTRHLPSNQGVNNNNRGVFVEYPLTHVNKDLTNWALTGGEFKNSLNRKTGFFGIKWTPVRFGKFNAGVTAALDLTNGYNVTYPTKYNVVITKDATGHDVRNVTVLATKRSNPLHPLIGAVQMDYRVNRVFGISVDVLPMIANDKSTCRVDPKRPGTETCASAHYTPGIALAFAAKYTF